MTECDYIIVIDATFFFYQWKMYFDDKHKLTIISHREQESFNIVVMNYKNSSTYMQRQINRILRFHRKYARAYVNDIVIFSKILKNHVKHLYQTFNTLNLNNIFLQLKKIFIDYSIVQLLNQKIDSFDLTTVEDKLRAIILLKFFKNFRQLKSYLGLTEFLRKYISHYVGIFKLLQIRKIELFRNDLKVDNERKIYFSKTRLQHFIEKEIIAFEILQNLLSQSFYLIHVDIKRSLFVDLNASKKFEFDTMIYHIKEAWLQNIFAVFEKNIIKCDYSFKIVIESILFLNRLFNSVETRY